MTSLQDNEDVIVEIIKFLNIQEKLKFRAVCRKWYHLIERNLSRTRVLANIDTKNLGYRNSACSDPRHQISRLNTIEYPWRHDSEKFSLLLSNVLNHFYQLTALYLHDFKISTNQVSQLADFPFCGTTLSHLSLTACDLGLVSRREWSYLCSKVSPQLVHLTLYQNKNMSRDKLFIVKRYCTSLIEINYDLFKADSCLDTMIPDNLNKLHVHISDVPITRLKHMFVDALKHQINLTHLRLPCISMYYCHLEAICATLRQLVCLEVPLVKDYLDHEPDCGIVIGDLPLLECFTLLSFHFDVTDQDPPNIDKMITKISQRRGRRLRSLKIGQYSITRDTFIEITSNCLNLQEFHYFLDDRCGYWGHRNLFLINGFLDDDVGKLLASLESLRVLNISYSVISDHQIASIIESCHNLRRLHLNQCKFAGLRCLEAFIDSARKAPNEAFYLILGHLNEIMSCFNINRHKLQLPANLNCDCFHQECDIDVVYD
uniref:F-box domain-containing protein n=1 Tax=Tetranychus urticae TaxID=32264 RepID=T1K890_TETUR